MKYATGSAQQVIGVHFLRIPSVLQTCSSDWKPYIEIIWEYSSESSGVPQMKLEHFANIKRYTNHILPASMHGTMLVVVHLSTYSHWYVNKTFVFIPSAFLMFCKNFSFPIPHCCPKLLLYVCFNFQYSLDHEFKDALHI